MNQIYDYLSVTSVSDKLINTVHVLEQNTIYH